MNTFKDVWKQFKLFIRFDIDTLQKISNDRYESGNAFLIVFTSLLSLYLPVMIISGFNNLSDIIFFGILDGAFAWVFSSLAMWFMLGKVFKENLDINSVTTITGYTHGLVLFISLGIFLQSYFSIFDLRVIQIFTLGIFFWMYLAITKSLETVFFIEKNNAKISGALFLFILIWTSGPLKIVF
ncbi:MAG: hypothetical protein ACJ0HM_00165 [Candidatus Actinomarina sp.]